MAGIGGLSVGILIQDVHSELSGPCSPSNYAV